MIRSVAFCFRLILVLSSQTNMKRILIANNHDSFVYNLVELLRRIGQCDITVCMTDEIDERMPHAFDGLLLSPGPGVPTEQTNLMRLIDRYKGVRPILGVCLGHQAIAEYFGCRLQLIARPLHGHTDRLCLQGAQDPLFAHLPPQALIGRYHSWCVDPQNVSDSIVVTATAESDRCIMAIRHRTWPIHGVQFHPESYMTMDGEQMLRNWLDTFGK